MTVNDNEVCKGCFDTINGCIVTYSKMDTCPCKDCLIKGICKDDCEDFSNNLIGIEE